ncbi:MAG TPA: hypothetical protein PL076_09615, partial [Bacillota bacterium]|nr:hypothetical protein [Bacillota bacterium]
MQTISWAIPTISFPSNRKSSKSCCKIEFLLWKAIIPLFSLSSTFSRNFPEYYSIRNSIAAKPV